MFLILLPLVQGRDWGWPAWGWGLLATGVITVAGFLTHERALAHRGGQPVLDPGLLRVRPFTAGLAASVLFFGGLASFFLVLSIYLQTGTGRSAWHTGLVTLPYAIGSMLTSGAGCGTGGTSRPGPARDRVTDAGRIAGVAVGGSSVTEPPAGTGPLPG